MEGPEIAFAAITSPCSEVRKTTRTDPFPAAGGIGATFFSMNPRYAVKFDRRREYETSCAHIELTLSTSMIGRLVWTLCKRFLQGANLRLTIGERTILDPLLSYPRRGRLEHARHKHVEHRPNLFSGRVRLARLALSDRLIAQHALQHPDQRVTHHLRPHLLPQRAVLQDQLQHPSHLVEQPVIPGREKNIRILAPDAPPLEQHQVPQLPILRQHLDQQLKNDSQTLNR